MDSHYIEQILQGNHKAFEHLVNKYKDMSYTIAYRILRQEQEAEECVQDAFMKVYRSLASFKEGAKFSTWLYKIVYNSALSRLKSHIGHSTLFVSIDDKGSAESEGFQFELKNADQKKYIQLALDRLEKQDSLLLTLFYLSELSIEEIEGITSLSVGNIKVRLHIHRARKRLLAELKMILKTETFNLL